MKIAEALQQAQTALLPLQDSIALEVTLAFVLKKDKSFLFVHPEFELKEEQIQAFSDLVDRLKIGEPLAQIIGVKEFYGRDFAVNEHVLIPRPESEFLVEYVVNWVKNVKNVNNVEKVRNVKDVKNVKISTNADGVRILDVGTGSGNILLSILKELPSARGVGVDVSNEALKMAQKNLLLLQMESQAQLMESFLMEKVEGEFNVVVANLPYIGTETFNFVSDNTFKFEPHVALFGGSDGLELYRQLFQQLNDRKSLPELFLGEFGFGQSEKMQELLTEYFPQCKRQIIQDYAGIDRVFVVHNLH